MENKHTYLLNAYNSLVQARMVRNKKDFAEQIGWNYTSLSSAFNGRQGMLTSGLFMRIKERYTYFDEEWNYKAPDVNDKVDKLLDAIGELLKQNNELIKLIKNERGIKNL